MIRIGDRLCCDDCPFASECPYYGASWRINVELAEYRPCEVTRVDLLNVFVQTPDILDPEGNCFNQKFQVGVATKTSQWR